MECLRNGIEGASGRWRVGDVEGGCTEILGGIVKGYEEEVGKS